MCSTVGHEDGTLGCYKLRALSVSTLGKLIYLELEKILQESLLHPLSAMYLEQLPNVSWFLFCFILFVCLFHLYNGAKKSCFMGVFVEIK